MNIIINGFQDIEQIPVVEKIYKELQPQSLWYITLHSSEKEVHKVLPQAKLLFWDDLYRTSQIYDYPQSSSALDAALLQKMAKWEVIVLKMMDRFETLRDFSYIERKKIYLAYLQYWNAFIRKNRIDFFVAANIPHEVFDFVLYALLREKKIKTLMFFQSQIKDVILPMEHFDRPVIGFLQELAKVKKMKSPPTLAALADNFQQSIAVIVKSQAPFYMKKTSPLISLFLQLKKALLYFFHKLTKPKDKSFAAVSHYWSIFCQRIRHYSLNKKLWQEYNKHAVVPDFHKPYVYLALHYQPELTTSPLAGVWVDQELIVNLISRCLPPGITLYVKEHPKQTILSRALGQYTQISKKENVELIKQEVSTFELIEHSLAVATCTGTVGWEALIKGKAVLIFGHIFYSGMKGTYVIEGEKSLQKALHAIINAKEKISVKENLPFLLALQQTSITGFIDPGYASQSDYNFAQSNQAIAEYIISYAKKNIL